MSREAADTTGGLRWRFQQRLMLKDMLVGFEKLSDPLGVTSENKNRNR